MLYLLVAVMAVLFSGCSNIEDSFSEEEAKQMVLKQHRTSIGTPIIVSIDIKYNAYYVRWENKENKESRIDKVTKDGKVEMVEAQIE